MRQNPVKACIDRSLPAELWTTACLHALRENSQNTPTLSRRTLLPGVIPHPPLPLLAALSGKLWRPSRTLRIGFFDGYASIRERIPEYANIWSQYANVRFEFADVRGAEIRISFRHTGSWSYIGTDALSVPPNKPTMNLGWLTPDTDESEFRRVVLHEFGHALGCVHEHQSPAGGIPWDRQAVYEFYAGPPNYWSKDQVDRNIFERYSAESTQFSEFDPESIMLYPIPDQLTLGTFEIGWNNILSPIDKKYGAALYPFQAKEQTELTIDARAITASIGTYGEVDAYTFRVVGAGSYHIETHGDTDMILSLFGPNDDTLPLAFDDNSGRLANARVIAFLEPGIYTIRVRHAHADGRGNYSIDVRTER